MRQLSCSGMCPYVCIPAMSIRPLDSKGMLENRCAQCFLVSGLLELRIKFFSLKKKMEAKKAELYFKSALCFSFSTFRSAPQISPVESWHPLLQGEAEPRQEQRIQCSGFGIQNLFLKLISETIVVKSQGFLFAVPRLVERETRSFSLNINQVLKILRR